LNLKKYHIQIDTIKNLQMKLNSDSQFQGRFNWV